MKASESGESSNSHFFQYLLKRPEYPETYIVKPLLIMRQFRTLRPCAGLAMNKVVLSCCQGGSNVHKKMDAAVTIIAGAPAKRRETA
jgi:hypothetical protein